MARHMTALTTLSRGAACATVLLAALAGCQRTQDSASFLKDAQRYRQKGDNKSAIIEFKNAVQQAPQDAGARLLLGQMYIEVGDPLSAEKELRKALSLGATRSAVIPSLGKAMLTMGQFDKVLAEIPADPADAEQIQTLGLRANAYLGLGDAEQAGQLFDRMLKKQPGQGEALLGLARIALAAGQLEKAGGLLEQALRNNPADIDGLRLKADMLHTQGKNEDALLLYARILALHPDNAQAHIDIANLHIQSGKFVEASAEIEAARKAKPNNVMVLYAQALLDFREGKNKSALDELQRVLQALPEHMPSILLMAAVQLALGSPQQAEPYLHHFLEANPRHPYASKMMASVALANGNPDLVVAMIVPLLRDYPKDVELLGLVGEAHMRARRFAQAAEYFEKASALAPQTAKFHTALGVSRLGMGENARAIAELERATALDAKGSQAGVMLVMTLLRDKEYDKGLAAAKALEAQQPGNPLAFNLEGGVHLGKKDYIKARASFERALAVDPAYLPAMQNLEQLDLVDKKPEQARKRYEAALAKDGKNANLMTALARLAAKQGNQAEATRWLERAVKDNPDALQPALQLGSYYLQAGEPRKGLALAKTLQAGNPDNVDALSLRAQAEYDTGNQADALESYSKLAVLQPGSASLQLRIAGIQMLLNDRDGALQSVKKALAAQPGLLEAQVTQLALLLDKHSYEEALSVAKGIQKQRPDLAAGFKLEGDVMLAQQKPLPALKLYEQAYGMSKVGPVMIQIHRALMLADKPQEADTRIAAWLRDNPDDVSTRLYLAGTKLAHKQYKSAIEQYENLLRREPGNIVALNDLAWCYQQDKDKRALPTAERAHLLAPANPAVLDTLGWILLEQGDHARALPLLQKAANLAPNAPEIGYHLGAAMLKAGDKKTARAQLEKILTSNKDFPNRADAQALLAQP